MQVLVERFFHIDFMLMDLFFCLFWVTLLLKYRYKLEFALGILGICVNFFVDYGVWFNLQGIRTLDGPVNPLLFFIYFSITYGMIEYSYVAVMFREDNNRKRLLWTITLYSGWFISAVLSQLIPLNDIVIHVTREMAIYRIAQILIVVAGYLVLIMLRKKWHLMKDLTNERLVYLFLVGILVHFGMEFTLWLAGIRPGVVSEFLFNSFLEFNSGVPILFIIWTFYKSRTTNSSNERLTKAPAS